MPESNINPSQNKSSSGPEFVTKTVEMPILDSPVRQQVSGPADLPAGGGGVKAFYKANKIYFWAIIAGMAIISVLAYFAFKKTPQAPLAEARVEIDVSVPKTVPSGGEAVYTIILKNNDSQKLVNLELEVAYAEGMSYVASGPSNFKPTNLSGVLFPVPDLLPGQNTPLFLKTRVNGNVNDQKTLNLKLHYKYANFNSEFVKQQAAAVTLIASDIAIELDGPTTASNQQLVVYKIKYQNNSENEIKNARVKISYPEGFIFAQATPSPDLGTDTWGLTSLSKGGSGNIEIQGSFSATSPGESKSATTEFLILGNDGQFFIQNSFSFTTTISSLPLIISQELSSSNSKAVINPGDNLSFNLRYQNNASIVAHSVNIVVSLDSKVVDLSSLSAQGGQISNNTITWNAASISQLESLAPNESGQLSFSLKINNPATRDSSKNLTLVSNLKIKSNEYDSFFPGNQLSLKLSSPAALATALSFVSGQLPPKVGRSSTYKVRFSLSNSGNDFGSANLTAFIPLGAGGFVPASVTTAESANAVFDASSGKLTWNVGSLAAYAGKFGESRVLEFQVTLNPAAAQANSSPVLLKSISFSANDLFTSQAVSLTASDLTTASIKGSDGSSFGTVQP